MGKYLDFLVTLVCRFAAGAVGGAIVGFLFNWLPFLMGSARGRLPWHMLKWWALAGGIILVLTVPKHQRPWTRYQQ